MDVSGHPRGQSVQLHSGVCHACVSKGYSKVQYVDNVNTKFQIDILKAATVVSREWLYSLHFEFSEQSSSKQEMNLQSRP